MGIEILWSHVQKFALAMIHLDTVYANIYAAKLFHGCGLKVSFRGELFSRLGPKSTIKICDKLK
jgi:hypothetical protein